MRFLRSKLTKLVTQLSFELRNNQKLTSCITVKIRYTDFNTYTKQRRIFYTANDNTLLEQAIELFESLYSRRQLVRLIGVRLSGLVRGSPQLNLFDRKDGELALLQQMDRIRKRFGKGAILKASAL